MTTTSYSSKSMIGVVGLPVTEALAALARLHAVAPAKGSV